MNEEPTYEQADPMGDETRETGASTRKTGLVVAIAALVLVIAGGLFLYNALTQPGAGAGGTGGAATASEGGSSASSSGAGSSGSSDAEALWLADYNATVYTEDDIPLLLTEIAGGKPLVVNFWATWCPYCIQEMGDFQALYDEYGDRVEFAFVDCVDGQRETVSDGAAWMRDNGYELPAYYDTKLDAVYTFGVANLPTTMVVDENGEILALTPGRISPDRMRNALDALLDR